MTEASFFSLISRYRQLLSADGERDLNGLLVWSIVSGIVDGLALWCVLAGAMALDSGEAAFGLSMGWWLTILALLAVAGFVVAYVLGTHNYRSALDVMRNCHKVVGDKIARLPLGWFSGAEAARYSRALTKGMMDLGQVLAHMLGPTLSKVTQLVTLCVAMWLWNQTLALILTVALPVYFVVVWLVGRLANKVSTWHEISLQELSARMIEYAGSQRALRSAGRATNPPHLSAAVAEENRVARKALWGEVGLMTIAGMIAQAVVVTLMVAAAVVAIDGTVAPLLAVAFIGVCLRLYAIIVGIADGVIGAQLLRTVMAAITEVLDAEAMPEPAASAAAPADASVELDGISFGYHVDTPVLRDVTFAVPPRTMTALVGPSGSGKTTIARLISRFYDVDSGTVRVGGVDVRELTIADLMAQLSMVFQDVYLYDDTLLANIRVGNPEATDDELRAAADTAGVSEIVARLPRGWDTPVGEGGSKLSGGERQRVSIARALVKKAPIVLIDEATSALDAENEAHIAQALEDLRASSTVIVIAHKLNTIEHADQIVVLSEEGSVAQVGTHDELAATPGIYADFWRQRELAEGWRLVPAG